MHKKLIIATMISLSAGFAKSQTTPAPPINDTSLIAFASDTQAPMLVETIWLKAHHNRAATKMVFNDILSTRAGSLFLLGDVVNLGYSNRQWKPIDGYLKNL